MTQPSSEPRPSIWVRMWRSIVWSVTATVKILFVAAILLLLGAGGWLVGTTVDREYRTLQRRLALLEYAAELAATNDSEQSADVRAINGDIAQLNLDLEAATASLERDLERQDAALATLETSLTETIEQAATVAQSVETLNNAAAALQSDINNNITSIDELGGTNDDLDARIATVADALSNLDSSVNTELTTLEADVAALINAEAALLEMRETLALFRVWELVARARLRLAEDNIGLAADDISQAQTALTLIAISEPPIAVNAESTDEESESEDEADGDVAEAEVILPPLALVQTRLALAATALPDDPVTAAADLETVWDLLDTLLSERLDLPQPEPATQ